MSIILLLNCPILSNPFRNPSRSHSLKPATAGRTTGLPCSWIILLVCNFHFLWVCLENHVHSWVVEWKCNESTYFQITVMPPTLHVDFCTKEFVNINEEPGGLTSDGNFSQTPSAPNQVAAIQHTQSSQRFFGEEILCCSWITELNHVPTFKIKYGLFLSPVAEAGDSEMLSVRLSIRCNLRQL